MHRRSLSLAPGLKRKQTKDSLDSMSNQSIVKKPKPKPKITAQSQIVLANMRVKLRRKMKDQLPNEWVKSQITQHVMKDSDRQGVPEYRYLRYHQDEDLGLQFN